MAAASTSRVGVTRFARRGSARLAYEVRGAASGPAVVLLHDLLADRSTLAGPRDALVGAGFRVVLPDARGHGASAAVAGRRFPLAELVADVLAVLDAEAVARAHLVGYGLGGATAFDLARRTPERVASVALIEPTLPGLLAADPDPAAESLHATSQETARAAADVADRGQTERALDTLLDPRWGAGWRERLPRPRLAAIRRHAGALAPLLMALDAFTPSLAEAGRVVAPALVVVGAGAPALDRLVAERLVTAMPNARAATVPAPTAATAPGGGAGSEVSSLLVAFFDERLAGSEDHPVS